MTLFDRLFLALAALDVIAVAAMAWIGLRMLDSLKRAQRQADPAIQEARALAEAGKAIAQHAKADGLAITGRVKGVASKVKERVETTREILREIKPQGEQTAITVRETSADLARKARDLGELGRRINRIKSAAEAAARRTSG